MLFNDHQSINQSINRNGTPQSTDSTEEYVTYNDNVSYPLPLCMYLLPTEEIGERDLARLDLTHRNTTSRFSQFSAVAVSFVRFTDVSVAPFIYIFQHVSFIFYHSLLLL